MNKIVRAKYLRARIIEVEFSDGATGEYDLEPVAARDGVLTRTWREQGYFERFFLELGALCWPNGLEFSPEAIRRELAATGKLRQRAHVA
jgi:hypothetical protein